jgi:hypothetical protein
MTKESRMLACAAALCFALTACGGGGGGGVASTPPPPPAPPPSPPPPPPVPATASIEFDTLGTDIRIRYDASAKDYEVMLPGSAWATLVPSDQGNYVIKSSTGATLGNAYFEGSGKYSYTGIASISQDDGYTRFVYGTDTPASGVPVTGSASYAADFYGSGGGYSVGGTAEFDFDFAKGTLAGFLKGWANDPAGWGPYDLGQYNFVNTVYSTGSTTFSGGLSLDGGKDGSFNGLFTGPQAQELMGQWQLNFRDIYFPDQTVNASGQFIGKK